jgi:molecular chaperone GrpE
VTDKTGNNGASSPESAQAGSAEPAGADQQPTVIIRDKRKVDQAGKPKPNTSTGTRANASATATAASGRPATSSAEVDSAGGGTAGAARGSNASGRPSESASAASSPGARAGAASDGAAAAAVTPEDDGPAADAATAGEGTATATQDGAESTTTAGRAPRGGGPTAASAELSALRADIDERTKDLQRLSAEYANYRKRVERDRGIVAEQATGAVLAALLPVLDDLDRARDHGDLVGPFGSVAEQLSAALAKFGLVAFGEKGDPFDPTLHEAVAHQTSAEVTESTCVDVMRRGYLLGERLLRPALVAVADPE